jgi:hypothetical protein
MTCRLEFKFNDCWVGVFWRVGPPARLWALADASGYIVPPGESPAPRCWRVDLWVCLLPMLPIHFTWYIKADSYRPKGVRNETQVEP